MCSDTAHPLVSVIIPAYNAAATIGEAIRSVIAQTMTDWELIVVDDGSSDATASQALQAMRHAGNRPQSHTHLIGHDINRGSAAAWQTGLNAAKGRYVTKLDADDTLTPDALMALTDAATGDAQVIRGQFNRISGKKVRIFGPFPSITDLNDSPICVDYFTLCGKLIDRNLLTADGMAAFDRLDRWEDLGVVARVMALRPTTVTIGKAVYNYNIAPPGSSLSTSSRQRLLSDHIAIARLIDNWMRRRGIHNRYTTFLNHLKFASKVKYLRSRHRDVAAWKQTFPEVNNRVIKLRHVALHHRLLFATVSILPTRLSQFISDHCPF